MDQHGLRSCQIQSCRARTVGFVTLDASKRITEIYVGHPTRPGEIGLCTEHWKAMLQLEGGQPPKSVEFRRTA